MSLTGDQWLQVGVPVRKGGLGLRRVSSMASSAFLASAVGTPELHDHVLHRISLVNDDIFDCCLLTRVDDGTQPSVDSDSHKQRTCDKVVVDAEYSYLLRYSEPYKGNIAGSCSTSQWQLAPHAADKCMQSSP